MSAADSRSDRIRRCEEDGDDQQTAEAAEAQPNHPTVSTAINANQVAPSATDNRPLPPPSSIGVQPLPEQMRTTQRPSPRFSSPLDMLAMVELQICLQFLDTDSRLAAARCSRSLLQAASAPFAWSAPCDVIVEVQSATDVGLICSSLLRHAPIHMRCIRLESLLCVASVPHLVGLELQGGPMKVDVADAETTGLLQLLQHPNLARLQTLRLNLRSSQSLLTNESMRLISRLPQLRSFNMHVTRGVASVALLKPLSGAPRLTHIAIDFNFLRLDDELTSAISGCARLRRLSLRNLSFNNGAFIAFCSSPSMRQLQHLQLVFYRAADVSASGVEPPDADEYRAAFSALEQLQSMMLKHVWSIDALLPHLHCAPALRLLFIRCQPNYDGISVAHSLLPSRAALSSLLIAAPQLEVRLLMPATLERWLALGRSIGAGRDSSSCELQWRELQRACSEMDRVTIVDEEPPSD